MMRGRVNASKKKNTMKEMESLYFYANDDKQMTFSVSYRLILPVSFPPFCRSQLPQPQAPSLEARA